jgi:hypothetical protein
MHFMLLSPLCWHSLSAQQCTHASTNKPSPASTTTASSQGIPHSCNEHLLLQLLQTPPLDSMLCCISSLALISWPIPLLSMMLTCNTLHLLLLLQLPLTLIVQHSMQRRLAGVGQVAVPAQGVNSSSMRGVLQLQDTLQCISHLQSRLLVNGHAPCTRR